MLDIYDFCYTAESKLIPSEKQGKRAYKAQESIKALGGAGNVASNVSSLGVSTVFITVCGNDGHKHTLKELANKSRIHHFFIQDKSRTTTTKTRLYIDDEYILRRDDEIVTGLSDKIIKSVMKEFRRELKGTDAVILSDYNKGFFSETFSQDIISSCRERGIPVIVDFKPLNRSFFKGGDILVPNRPEAGSMHSGFLDGANFKKATLDLYDLLECSNLIITLGDLGLCGYDGKAFFHVLSNKIHEVDSVGCGDTVRAGLALGFATGLTLHEAMSLANDAAAIVCQKVGTAFVSHKELKDFIAQKNDEV